MGTSTKAKSTYGAITGQYTSLSASIQRLSTGLKRSDNLDLSIRELLRSDISALQQGVRNANDAISLLQTAAKALNAIADALRAMRDLAKEASARDRKQDADALETAYQDLADRITDIATTTEFRGLCPLDGSLAGDGTHGQGLFLPGVTKQAFGTSAAVNDTVIEIPCATATAFGLGHAAGKSAPGYSIASQKAAERALVCVHDAQATCASISEHLEDLQSTLAHTITMLTVHSQNLQSAETRITDVDIANEMTIFVKQQILTHSVVAMLSQASPISDMAMSLVR